MLKLDHISYAYDGGQSILKDISFALPQGEHLAVMGESGCGKSTLLKAIYGLIDGVYTSAKTACGGLRVS